VAMRPPPIPSFALSRRFKIILSVIAIIIVLLIVLSSLTGVYINWLWYGSVGYRNVYTTMFWTRFVLFFIFGVLMALIICGNLFIAYRLRPPFRPMSAEQQNLERYRVLIEPRKRLILIVAAAISLLAAGLSAQGNWSEWQLWLHGQSFGQTDPQFHLDISFYAWDYPVYRTLLGFGFTAVIFSLILSIIVHYLVGAIRLQTPGPKVTPTARRHLTMLVFVFMVLKALAYWLDRYGLVFSGRSKFTGASYTDIHAALPAKTILFWIAILIAAGVLASMWMRSSLIPGIGFVSMLILSILISGIYPALVQSISVRPSASDKERPYITRNINATRDGYDIETQSSSDPNGTVTYQDYPAAGTTVSATAPQQSNPTMDNIRILDPNVISPTFTAQQKIRSQYSFGSDLDIDRYKSSDGVEHDYVVGVRTIQPSTLSANNANNWINQHTVYTHGYGFVAAAADTDITNGASYSEYGIPQMGSLLPSDVTPVPQVYYGEDMTNYVIAGAKGTPRESDGDGSKNTTYTGTGGVSLGNFFTRLAFAVHYKETNFVLNDAARASGSRVLFNRDPRELVQKAAPFLTIDSDPYPVLDSKTGHIVWMVDGYTTMANYPYSERQSLSTLTGTSVQNSQSNRQINYIRNSVKATVDAYTGKVTLYDWDSSDPILQSWMKVFPGLVQPKSAMPSELASHVRYPEDLFDVQRALIGTYHVSDPVTLYNVRDKWTVPTDPNPSAASGNQPSYYVLANDPSGSSSQPQFQLTTPMVVNNSTNLAAYLSVDSDSDNYGKITADVLSTNVNVPGPTQVANDFKSNSLISEDITLLGSGQSSVIHGNLLTLPVGNTFMYVEPLYVEAGTFPVIQRVLIYYNGKIGYGPTLNDALSDFLPGHTTGETVPKNGGVAPTTGNTSSPSPTQSSSAPSSGTSSGAPTQQQLLAQLQAANTALQAAYKTGDPTKIAEAQAAVFTALNAYLNAAGPPTSGSSTPTGSQAPSPKPTVTPTK
jgi:uncharacterized protein